ncbi:expressed unknown protein [Seminavis robusta]|uniref:Uncharacterized protein n=1 Tax=Seminavis robusta TaxID=568900 RepID=A0A9N8H422_9STRA|nr:expressed unknown protein [Seminavis robusta]|eukprot:Sro74_g040940.1 n/a (358) ;mRNA; f:116329-117402
MFKARKRNVKQKGALRRKKDEEEEEEKSTQKAQQEEDETAATIARVKKKRKLLTELQYKKGTDAASLLKGRDDSALDSAAGVDGTSTTVDQPDGSQEGVMEQKHKQALEQYVESKLVGMVGGDNNNNKPTSITNNNQDDSTTSNPNNNNKLTKEELYRQIAQTSENMVGRSSSTNQGDSKKDGDVGTGGAMLVAGTGLAEVILPVDERIKAVHATQEAAAVGPRKHAHHNNNNKSYGNMPKSQVPVLPAGAARFQVSAADRHRHFPSNQRNNNTASVPTTATTESVPEGDDDPGRVGFDAARGKAVASQTQNNNNHNNGQHNGRNNNNNNNHKNRSSDDKVYGNFLKHHRENQWRGR